MTAPKPQHRRPEERARVVAHIHHENESLLHSLRVTWPRVKPRIMLILGAAFAIAALAIVLGAA